MIPLFKPSNSELEERYVLEVLRSGWWGLGPKTEELEAKFADRVGARYAVAVNSASMALQLSLRAMNVYGNVIMPALTFVSTALAAKHNGNYIVFADVEEDTLCIDWKDVANIASEYKKAGTSIDCAIPVWYGGTVTGIPEYPDFPRPVIEDCAHAAGSRMAGKLGNVACWSFHAVKNMASGDGGMVTTNEREVYDRLRTLRWCGIDRSTWDREQGRYTWDYNIVEPGYKAHMNDITAAIALAQLERLDSLNFSRRQLVRRYLDLLKDCRLDFLLPRYENQQDLESRSWHLFVIRVPAIIRDRFIDHMLASGISVGVHYKPLNTYSMFPQQKLPVTDRVWKELVTLPLYPDMTYEDQDKVVAALKSF